MSAKVAGIDGLTLEFRVRVLFTKLTVVLVSFCATAITVAAENPRTNSKPALASFGVGADEVVLTDVRGKSIKWKSFQGQPRVLFFGFTHCPVVCPVTVWEIDAALNDIGSAAKDLKVIFVTLDPARDTAPVLTKYFEGFNGRVIPLTGKQSEITRLAKSFKVTSQRVDTGKGAYTIDHTTTAFLLNESGKVVDTLAFGASRELSVTRLKSLLAGTK